MDIMTTQAPQNVVFGRSFDSSYGLSFILDAADDAMDVSPHVLPE